MSKIRNSRTPDKYIIGPPENKALLEFRRDRSKRQPSDRYDQGGSYASLTDGYDKQTYFQPVSTLWQDWGPGNRFPYDVIALLDRNPIVEQIICTIRDFVCGKDWYLYRQRKVGRELVNEPIQNAQIEDWLEANQWAEQELKWVFDSILLGNAFLQVIGSQSGRRVTSISHTDPTITRVGEWNQGAVNYRLADWSYGAAHLQADPIPVYDPATNQPLSMFHLRRYRPGSFRYGVPMWIGSENFIRLMNEIPVFHLSGLRNQYGLRWHIEIPYDYFAEYPLEQQEAKELELKEKMDALLAGSDNVGKAILTKFKIDAMGKKSQGITITPLKPEIFDDAFSVIFDQAMIAVCSAQGINPELAGVIMQGKMSGNSGSGIRNAHNEYVHLKVPSLRTMFVDPVFNLVKQANQWPKDIYLGKIDYQLAKLDENADGGEVIVGE